MIESEPNLRYYVAIDVPSTGLGWKQYAFMLLDRDRRWNASCGFAVAIPADREWEHDRAERDLWLGVKRSSPGTYLDAKRLGLVPASVVRHDREPWTCACGHQIARGRCSVCGLGMPDAYR